MTESKSYRIRTNVGNDSGKVLHVSLQQTFDTLEILSLKLEQNNAYNLYQSDRGVVVGRVVANGGFGIPNAKVSVFIPVENNINLDNQSLYPYKSPTSFNFDSIRYNLLPDDIDDPCHQDVGTFPNKRLVLDNNDEVEIFGKYYKYTTVTNNAGDYMLFGVPAGDQEIHVDIDLSDIGILSQKPRDLTYKGYNIELFDTPTKFKSGTNLNSLTQIITENKSVYVYPYWGDTTQSEEVIAVTRCDIQIDYKFESTCVFMGSVITSTGEDAFGKWCLPAEGLGKMANLVTGEGTIEMIRKTLNNKVEQFAIKGNRVIDSDGVWCYQIPMNLDYVMTDEFGNIVPSNNPNIGIATRARVRFRVTLDDAPSDKTARKRCRYLIPNNPRDDEERYPEFSKNHVVDYEFGTKTAEENFRDLLWNNVYTVKNYIPRIQKNGKRQERKNSSIKWINHHGDNNPMPFNHLNIRLSFTYKLNCVLSKIFITLIGFLNNLLTIIDIIPCAVAAIFKAIGKATKWLGIGYLFIKISDIFFKGVIPCIALDGDLCDDNLTHAYTFYPGCGKFLGLDVGVSCIIKKTKQEHAKKHINGVEASEQTVPKFGSAELRNCIETALAQDNEAVSYNFGNDWINGVLYMPMWFRLITPKTRWLFGLFSRKAKDDWCTAERNFELGVLQTCAVNRNGSQHVSGTSSTVIQMAHNPCGNKGECTNKKNYAKFKYGIVVPKQTILDQTVYYYKPLEWVESSPREETNIHLRLLYATDIVLLGNLNEINSQGIPQFFKSLDSSTYNLPPALLQTDNIIGQTIKDASANDVVISLDVVDEDGNKLDYSLVSHSESTGADWANPNPDLCSSSYKSDDDKTDSGLFYGIGCTSQRMIPKSCINLSRICEFGVSIDSSKQVYKGGATINFNSDDIDDKAYYTLSPDGFISKDEIFDDSGRSAFATMNSNNLLTRVNEKNGTREYVFDYTNVDNFDGSLRKEMESYQKRCNKTPMYNYLFENASFGYYNFRMGKEPTFYDEYYEDGKNTFPRYENSFYFYFGLKSGKTAIEKFNKQFYSDCIDAADVDDLIKTKTLGNTWCSEVDIPDGYIAFDLDGIDLPATIMIIGSNDSDGDIIIDAKEERIYVSNIQQPSLEKDGYNWAEEREKALMNGTFRVIVTDINSNVYETFVTKTGPKINAEVGFRDFVYSDDTMLNMFGNDRFRIMEDNTGLFVTYPVTFYSDRTWGGTIAISVPKNNNRDDVSSYRIEIQSEAEFDMVDEEGNPLTYNISLVKRGSGRNYLYSTLIEGHEALLYGAGASGWNGSTFIFGLPMGGVEYTVRIIELCEVGGRLVDTNNIYEVSKVIGQRPPYKLYINGVDYDLIANWKCGFTAKLNYNNEPVVTPTNDLTPDSPWFHLSNYSSYNWTKYENFTDVDENICDIIDRIGLILDELKENDISQYYLFCSSIGITYNTAMKKYRIDTSQGSLFQSHSSSEYISSDEDITYGDVKQIVEIIIGLFNNSRKTFLYLNSNTQPLDGTKTEKILSFIITLLSGFCQFTYLSDVDFNTYCLSDNKNYYAVTKWVKVNKDKIDDSDVPYSKTIARDDDYFIENTEQQKFDYWSWVDENTSETLYRTKFYNSDVVSKGFYDSLDVVGKYDYISKTLVNSGTEEEPENKPVYVAYITQEQYDLLTVSARDKFIKFWSRDPVNESLYSVKYYKGIKEDAYNALSADEKKQYVNVPPTRQPATSIYTENGYAKFIWKDEFDHLDIERKGSYFAPGMEYEFYREIEAGEEIDAVIDDYAYTNLAVLSQAKYNVDDSYLVDMSGMSEEDLITNKIIISNEDYEKLDKYSLNDIEVGEYIKCGYVVTAEKYYIDSQNEGIYQGYVPYVYKLRSDSNCVNNNLLPQTISASEWKEYNGTIQSCYDVMLYTNIMETFQYRYIPYVYTHTENNDEYIITAELYESMDADLQSEFELSVIISPGTVITSSVYENLENQDDYYPYKYRSKDGSNLNISETDYLMNYSENAQYEYRPYRFNDRSDFDLTIIGVDDDPPEGYLYYSFTDVIEAFKEIIEWVKSAESVKEEAVQLVRSVFYISCVDDDKSVYFSSTSNDMPVKYHLIYKAEKYPEAENNEIEWEYNIIDDKFTYNSESVGISPITIPSISTVLNPRFMYPTKLIGNNTNLCYARDNYYPYWGTSEGFKYCKQAFFVSAVNNKGTMIPRVYDTIDTSKPSNLEFFGFHIIDKAFEVRYVAWSAFIKIPKYYSNGAEGVLGGYINMNGLFAGRIMNGNINGYVENSLNSNRYSFVEFEEQKVGDMRCDILTVNSDPSKDITLAEDDFPTQRYIINYDSGNVSKDFKNYKVCNLNGLESYTEQYAPITPTDLNATFSENGGCTVDVVISGRRRLTLSGSEIYDTTSWIADLDLPDWAIQHYKTESDDETTLEITDSDANNTVYYAFEVTNEHPYPLNIVSDNTIDMNGSTTASLFSIDSAVEWVGDKPKINGVEVTNKLESVYYTQDEEGNDVTLSTVGYSTTGSFTLTGNETGSFYVIAIDSDNQRAISPVCNLSIDWFPFILLWNRGGQHYMSLYFCHFNATSNSLYINEDVYLYNYKFSLSGKIYKVDGDGNEIEADTTTINIKKTNFDPYRVNAMGFNQMMTLTQTQYDFIRQTEYDDDEELPRCNITITDVTGARHHIKQMIFGNKKILSDSEAPKQVTWNPNNGRWNESCEFVSKGIDLAGNITTYHSSLGTSNSTSIFNNTVLNYSKFDFANYLSYTDAAGFKREFLGWANSSAPSANIIFGEGHNTYTVTGNVTFYAKWGEPLEEETCYVHWLDCGNNIIQTSVVKYGGTISKNAAPRNPSCPNSNQVFVDWVEFPAGTNTLTITSKNFDIHSEWRDPETYTVKVYSPQKCISSNKSYVYYNDGRSYTCHGQTTDNPNVTINDVPEGTIIKATQLPTTPSAESTYANTGLSWEHFAGWLMSDANSTSYKDVTRNPIIANTSVYGRYSYDIHVFAYNNTNYAINQCNIKLRFMCDDGQIREINAGFHNGMQAQSEVKSTAVIYYSTPRYNSGQPRIDGSIIFSSNVQVETEIKLKFLSYDKQRDKFTETAQNSWEPGLGIKVILQEKN